MILNKTEWIYTSYSLKNDYYILNLLCDELFHFTK